MSCDRHLRLFRFFTFLGVFLLLTAILAIPAAAAPKTGGVLVVAAEPLGETLEPGLWSGFGTITALDNIGEGLVRSNFTSGEPEPGLAESWKISSDGLTYTFKLRPGVSFHDGTALTTKAVVRSLGRYADEKEPSYVEGLYMQFGHGSANIASVKALDTASVEIVLNSPDATMLHRLARPSAFIISPTALDKYGAEIGKNLVMAGPFKLEKFVPGQEATLAAFEDYWGGRPYLDQVIVRGFADDGAVLAALQSGAVNFTTAAPLLAARRFANSSKIRVDVAGPLVDVFMGANLGDKVTGNRDVRLAVNYAINRDNLINVGLNGYGEQPASILAPNDLGFDETGRKISQYDPERAKEHVAKSGLATPIAVRVSFESVRFWPQLAELVKTDLEAVGFKVTLEPLDSSTFWTKVTSDEIQLTINQRSTFVPDPDDKALILNSTQKAGATNLQVLSSAAKMDDLLKAGVAEQDTKKRIEIYQQIQALALEEMPYIYLGYLTPPVFVSRSVQDVPVDAAAAGRATFLKVWLEQ